MSLYSAIGPYSYLFAPAPQISKNQEPLSMPQYLVSESAFLSK